MGKKKLDKLFQEKFKDFSEMPNDKVWHSIETSLDQKKKSRKVIPIWWKLGGVAAVLTIALFVINPFEKDFNETPTVTDVNNPSKKTSDESQQKNASKKDLENFTPNEIQIIVSGPEDTLVNEASEPKKQVTSNSNEGIKNLKSDSYKINSDNVILNKASSYDALVAANKLNKLGVEKDILKRSTAKNESDLISNDAESIAAVDENETQHPSAKPANQKDMYRDLNGNGKKEVITQLKKEAEKKSIFDEIASQEEEKDVLVENAGSKWSAGPSIAPVYFNAFGEGSPVHSIFVPNSKSGDVTLSYGLSVAYEVSKKLSIRSGVHKVNYGYNTNDVEFSSSVEASVRGQIDNVDYAITAKNLVVNSMSSIQPDALNQNSVLNAKSSEVSAVSASRDGIMEQQFGYLEVPVELNYTLIDKRFGINLIGGVSSLFLINNTLSLTSGELTTEMGEANNVNAVNFSTNVGFGVNYKFTPKLKLNIEPVFKYQLNTFSTTDGSFQPFTVGVYSGLSFKF